MKNRRPQITVIGDSEVSPSTYKIGVALGKLLANMNICVITGGKGGIMEAVSKGVNEAGGVSVGILPSTDFDEANEYNSIIIPTGLGHTRNAITVLAGNIIIALGGGAGTLSELCFAWIHHKPILTLKGFGGWADKLAHSAIDGRREDRIFECKDLEELSNTIIDLSEKMNLQIEK